MTQFLVLWLPIIVAFGILVWIIWNEKTIIAGMVKRPKFIRLRKADWKKKK